MGRGVGEETPSIQRERETGTRRSESLGLAVTDTPGFICRVSKTSFFFFFISFENTVAVRVYKPRDDERATHRFCFHFSRFTLC